MAQLSRYANGSFKRCFVPVVQNLRENGVDINPALISAARKVDFLRAAGADKNMAGQHSRTLLFLAASEGHEAVVFALLAAGADKNRASQTLS